MTATMYRPARSTGAFVGPDEWGMSSPMRTTVDPRSILDAAVRAIVVRWNDPLPGLDEALAANDNFRSRFLNTTVDCRSAVWISSEVIERAIATASVVDVVQSLAAQLAFPVDRVLKAASVKRRTYHSWAEKPDARPRLSSQGRLWSLAQCVQDLTTLLGPPGRWLQQGSRMGLFESGAFDALVELAVDETRPPFDDPNQGTYSGGDSTIVGSRTSGGRPVMRPVKRFRD